MTWTRSRDVSKVSTLRADAARIMALVKFKGRCVVFSQDPVPASGVKYGVPYAEMGWVGIQPELKLARQLGPAISRLR